MTFLFLFIALWSHPVFVSVTNMDIDAQKKEISMSLSIFTEDMEVVLHNKYNIDGWIGTAQENPQCRELIKQYMNERFVLQVNRNEKLELKTDSIVVRDDAVWIYTKGYSSQFIRSVEIDNRILTDFFSSQTNLVIINTGRTEKGYKLSRQKSKIELSL